MIIYPSFLQEESLRTIAGEDRTLLEIKDYLLSLKTSSQEPKSIMQALALSIGSLVKIDKGLQTSDILFSFENIFRFLSMISTAHLVTNLGTNLLGRTFTRCFIFSLNYSKSMLNYFCIVAHICTFYFYYIEPFFCAFNCRPMSINLNLMTF